jgi:hypothetical protein
LQLSPVAILATFWQATPLDKESVAKDSPGCKLRIVDLQSGTGSAASREDSQQLPDLDGLGAFSGPFRSGNRAQTSAFFVITREKK